MTFFDLPNDSEGMEIAGLNADEGNRLEQPVFSAGDKITVKCQQGQLIITKSSGK